MSTLTTFTGRHLLIVAILALGAVVRFVGLGGGWFHIDQVRDAMAAQGILRGYEFPLVGPQSAQGTVRLVGPLYYYLVAIPYGVSADPVVGVAFVNLLGLLSIYLTYRLGREMFGPVEGWVAAALYAVFPMAVFSSKALWNPGFLPFFATLFLLSLWRFLTGRRPWAFALVLFLLGVLLQIHISGAIFMLLVPVALLMYRPPVQPWPLVTGLLGVAVLYAPYVVFQVQHGFPDADKVFAWAGTQTASSFWLIAGRGFWFPFVLPERLATALGTEVSPSSFPLVQRAEVALLSLGLLVLLLLMIKAKDRRPYVFLGLWFALPFVLVPYNRVGVMYYYFDILYPSQFLVIGVLLRMMLTVFPKTDGGWWAHEGCRISVALVIAIVVATQLWFTLSYNRALRRAGLLKIPWGIRLSAPDMGHAAVETMPLRDRKALLTSLVSEFGVELALLERQAHGAIYHLFREDRGLLWSTLRPRRLARQPDSALHYLLVNATFSAVTSGEREVKVGAYRIIAYEPAIEYASWKWSVSPEAKWWRQALDDSSWTRVTFPVREALDPTLYAPIPFGRWPAKTVMFRGQMMVSSVSRAAWLVLNIRDSSNSRHEVAAFYVNGRPPKVGRAVAHDSLESRNVEVLMDVTSNLRTGSNSIAFEVSGMDGEFDLDVYEFQLADPNRRATVNGG